MMLCLWVEGLCLLRVRKEKEGREAGSEKREEPCHLKALKFNDREFFNNYNI